MPAAWFRSWIPVICLGPSCASQPIAQGFDITPTRPTAAAVHTATDVLFSSHATTHHIESILSHRDRLWISGSTDTGAYAMRLDPRNDSVVEVLHVQSDEMVRIYAMAAVDADVLLAFSHHGRISLGSRSHEGDAAGSCTIARVRATGEVAWSRAIGSGVATCRAFAVPDAATGLVVGLTRSELSTRAGAYQPETAYGDGFLVFFDLQSGALERALLIGTPGEDMVRDAVVLADDRLAVGGSFAGSTDGEDKFTLRLGDHSIANIRDHDGFVAIFEGTNVVGLRGFSTPGFDVVKKLLPYEDSLLVAGVGQDAPPAGVPGLVSGVPLHGFVELLDAGVRTQWRWSPPGVVSVGDIALDETTRQAVIVGHYRASFAASDAPEISAPAGSTGMFTARLRLRGAPVVDRVWTCDGPGLDLGHHVVVSDHVAHAVVETDASNACAPQLEGPASFIRRYPLES